MCHLGDSCHRLPDLRGEIAGFGDPLLHAAQGRQLPHYLPGLVHLGHLRMQGIRPFRSEVLQCLDPEGGQECCIVTPDALDPEQIQALDPGEKLPFIDARGLSDTLSSFLGGTLKQQRLRVDDVHRQQLLGKRLLYPQRGTQIGHYNYT